MVTRRGVIVLGGAAAVTALSTGHLAVEAKKKKKKTRKVTEIFSSAASITTDDVNARANPYPSPITVSGLKKGKILKVRVLLNEFTSEGFDDIDIMLSATQMPGTTAVIMSDVGGATTDPVTVNLVLDDEAANRLPPDGPLTSGTFKPTNDIGSDGADMFPAPAPTPSGNSALNVFNGGDPNGEWQLWVIDSPGNGPAKITSWGIEITAQVKKKKKKKKK